MSSLMRSLHAASAAVDALATMPGTSTGDRARALSALRQRIDDQIVSLGRLAEIARAQHLSTRRPVSQLDGD